MPAVVALMALALEKFTPATVTVMATSSPRVTAPATFVVVSVPVQMSPLSVSVPAVPPTVWALSVTTSRGITGVPRLPTSKLPAMFASPTLEFSDRSEPAASAVTFPRVMAPASVPPPVSVSMVVVKPPVDRIMPPSPSMPMVAAAPPSVW